MKGDRTDSPAILIVSYGSPDLLRCCLRSLQRFASGCEIFVYDNLSESSGQISLLSKEFPGVSWQFGASNIGFAAAVNLLSQRTSGDFLLVNPDAEVARPLDDFLEYARSLDKACCIAPGNVSDERYWDVAHRSNGLIRSLVSHAGYSGQFRGMFFSELYSAPPTRPVGYLGGAFLYVTRRAWTDVGNFDESFFLYSEEVDWQRRAKQAGYASHFFDSVIFRHSAQGTVAKSQVGLSRSAQLLRNSQAIYFRKHHGAVTANIFKLGLSFLDKAQRSKRRTEHVVPDQSSEVEGSQ